MLDNTEIVTYINTLRDKKANREVVVVSAKPLAKMSGSDLSTTPFHFCLTLRDHTMPVAVFAMTMQAYPTMTKKRHLSPNSLLLSTKQN